MTNEDAARLGRQAEQVKPILDAAVKRLQEEAVRRLLTMSPGNVEVANVHAEMRAAERVAQLIVQQIANGQQAEQSIKDAQNT